MKLTQSTSLEQKRGCLPFTWPGKAVNLVPESHFPFVQISSIYPTTAAKARNWYIPSGKTGLPFHMFRCSQKFSAGTNKKVAFHLLSNRNFLKLLVVFDLRLLIVNEFLSITSLEFGPSLASMRIGKKPAGKGKLKKKKR